MTSTDTEVGEGSLPFGYCECSGFLLGVLWHWWEEGRWSTWLDGSRNPKSSHGLHSTPSSPGRDECLSPLLNLLWPTLVRKWGTSSQPSKGFPLSFGCLGLGRNRVFSLKCLAKVGQYCSKGFLFCWVTPLLVLCLERVGSFCT